MKNRLLISDYIDNNPLNLPLDGFIIHSRYSLSTFNYFSIDNILKSINLIKSEKKIAICAIDRIIEEDELEEVHNLIKSIIIDIDYIFYSDYSIYYYVFNNFNEYLNKLIYNPKTLVCNIHEFNNLSTSAIISSELSYEQIKDINDNYDLDFINQNKYLGIKAFGYHQIFFSKRPLLSLYDEYYNKNIFEFNKLYDLQETNREDLYKIIEKDFGTLIYYALPYVLYNELEYLDNFKFIYMNSEFIDQTVFSKVCFYYYDFINNKNNHYEELISLIKDYSRGFLDKKSVLLKETSDE